MNLSKVTRLLLQINRTATQTLRGGNGPEDSGDVRAAVAELAEVLRAVIHALYDGKP